MIYAIPLMIVALAGIFAERSGVINLALEGIMIFGAFIGVLFVRTMQENQTFTQEQGQLLVLLAFLVAAVCGALFSLLLSFSAITLKADQTIGGTALNMLAPAIVLFFITMIAQQNVLRMFTGDSASWFMIKPTTFGYERDHEFGFFGNLFLNKVYITTYLCIIIFVVLSVILYKTRFGLRLRACGENPQAADSLGINVYKMRYAGVTISGALAGLAGVTYYLGYLGSIQPRVLSTVGFDSIAISLLGNSNPIGIVFASFLITVITKGSTYMSSSMGVDQEIGSVITGLMLLFAACGAYVRHRLRISRMELEEQKKEEQKEGNEQKEGQS